MKLFKREIKENMDDITISKQYKRIIELEQINEEHRKINGELREKNRRLQQLCNAYEKEHSESFEIWKNDRMKVNKAIRLVRQLKGSARWERHLFEIDYLLDILQGDDKV